jgi:hypothetical protein
MQPEPDQDPIVRALLGRISAQAAQSVRQARMAAPRDQQPQESVPVSVPQPDNHAMPAGNPGRRASDQDTRPRLPAMLSDHAVGLLQALPHEMRLPELRRAFPRILNHIAALWDDPRALHRYFDTLLIDTRGSRQGFSFGVVAELSELRAYHLRIIGGGRY